MIDKKNTDIELSPEQTDRLNKLKVIIDEYEETSLTYGPASAEELKNRIPIYLALKNNSPAFRFILDRIHSIIGYISSKEKAVKIINKVIIESKKKYNSRFEGDFYVILWPRLVDDIGFLNKKFLRDL